MEKQRWTIRSIDKEAIKKMRTLTAQYGCTNGELISSMIDSEYDRLLDSFERDKARRKKRGDDK
jgi:hypothetical protein